MDQYRENPKTIANIVELVNKSHISSIKSVASSIIRIINDPNSTAKDLKDIIQIDPPLTAKLLMLVNSPYYSLPEKISNIMQAVILIGFDALKELALNQKVCEVFMRDESFEGYSRITLWKHSVAVALFGKKIYRREFREKGENAYAAGLLHDIGIIVEDQFLQEHFKHILTRSMKEKRNLSEAEQEVLGYNHTEIGMAIIENWDFPEELVLSIGYHHTPEKVFNPFGKLVSTLSVADYFCQENCIGYGDVPFRDRVSFEKCLNELDVKPHALDLIMKDVKQDLTRMEDQGLL